MAGNVPGFDPDAFRSAIRFAMTMGAPPDVDRQATFVFPKVRTVVGGNADPSGVPLDPNVQVTFAASKPAVRVPCGIEYADAATVETSVGGFGGDRIVLTLLDTDYKKVQGFEFVVFNGVPYYYVQDLRASGLGTVGVYQIECQAEAQR